jgi:UPF0716 protein FxsA
VAFVIFFILFGIPVIEIALFIKVGGAIGLGPTLAIVILSAVAGAMLIRTQGLRTWMQARASLERGEMPVRELFDGLCVFAAGILLVTPGFFTDALALLLLLLPLRHLLAERLVRSMVVMHGGRGDGGAGTTGRQRPVVIETEFHEVPDDDTKDGTGDGPARRG